MVGADQERRRVGDLGQLLEGSNKDDSTNELIIAPLLE